MNWPSASEVIEDAVSWRARAETAEANCALAIAQRDKAREDGREREWEAMRADRNMFQAENARLRALLIECNDALHDPTPCESCAASTYRCNFCGACDCGGHEPDCRYAAALASAPKPEGT